MIRDEILAAAHPLIGLPWSIARRGASMRVLHFGAVTEGDDGSWGEYALHLQCPWRIDGPGGTLTGQDDLWEHATLEVPPKNWSFEQSESLQDARPAGLSTFARAANVRRPPSKRETTATD